MSRRCELVNYTLQLHHKISGRDSASYMRIHDKHVTHTFVLAARTLLVNEAHLLMHMLHCLTVPGFHEMQMQWWRTWKWNVNTRAANCVNTTEF